jgi:hypothetical protein
MKCVYGFEIKHGASTLFELVERKERNRLYQLSSTVEYTVKTDNGTLHVKTLPGFLFDGRSGPSIIDWYAPNLGTLEERLGWHMHDCLGYAQSLNFKDTNLMLKFWLRDMCCYSKAKSEIIRLAVSISDSWYGVPNPGDKFYFNLPLVETEWRPR